jgi:EAL domain-containing protein (putative c-di-GMP-specific phosphodiesterase class I)
MGEIDRWVVRNVFRRFDGRLRHLAVDAPPVASINLSGASMSDQSLLRFIRAQFEQYDVPHHAICFEITETAAVQNLSNATEFINDLRDMGCRFALDDFGAGLSSFAYLKNLPVDYLKIDGGFVKGMLEDPMSRAIVAACSQIGRALGIGTIAEFVEDTALLEALAEMGVDYGQGYGIHKPESLDNILRATRPGLAAVAG